MYLGRIANRALALLVTGLMVCAAQGQYRPEVPVLKCAHQGEAVPAISGAVFQGFYPPGIDAAGNVLISASMTGPGIGPANNEGIWFGQPGALTLVVRDGWAAPDLPGVAFSSVAAELAAVSENGWIVFTAYLSGSGVVHDVNDRAVFCGPPGDIRLVMRTGDPVPELGPNMVISGTDYMGAGISDNGTVLVGAGLAGSGLPPTYDRAYWVGPRGSMELALWEGMPVQGCPTCQPGVYFGGIGNVRLNDDGAVAFDGGLTGPGIHWYDCGGRWIGPPGALTMALRAGTFDPLFGPGVWIIEPRGGAALNHYGDQVNRVQLYGVGITTSNDWALRGSAAGAAMVIAREGDPTPEAGEGTYIASVSAPFVNDLHQVLYRVKFGGSGISASNQYAMYLGSYGAAERILRDGMPAPYFASGTSLFNVGLIWGMTAMNDVGDFVGVAGVESPATGRLEALGLWRGLTREWVPLRETGAVLFGRVLTLADPYCDYGTETGGADGLPQSFNDRRQLATLLDFTDGTSGVYQIGPPLLGDTDGDGQVGPAELLAFAGAAAGPGASVSPGCEALDLNLDGAVDLRDLALLQAMVGEER